ncbi:MAG: hypothetical protein ABIN55_05430 [Aeromicrobium sp.]
MTTSTVTPEIAKFAQGVRAALADLPADEVDDLTDGLEADLAEAYAEDLQRELPDPSVYATELRLAAGLPARSKIRHGALNGIGDSLRETRRDIGIAIHRNPALAGFADFLVTLRPVWWVFRAWLATWLVASFFGSEQGYWFSGTGWFLVLAAFIVISVQWGRGEWRGKSAAPLIALGNVFAILVLLPVMAAADDGGSDNYSAGYEDAVKQKQIKEEGFGIGLDGQQLSNIFAYDSAGNPLQGVQLFDQMGKPLNVGQDATGPECNAACEFDIVRLPKMLENGRVAWNVFPLQEVRADQTTYDERLNRYTVDDGAKTVGPMSPFLKVPAVKPEPKTVKPTP